MSITRHYHLVKVLTIAYWQIQQQYRLGALLWLLNGFITPLIIMGVWLVVNQTNQLSLTHNQIISYYLYAIVIYRLTQTWLAQDLTNSIKEGQFNVYLVKPFSFAHNFFANDQAVRSTRLLSLAPLMILVIILLADKIVMVMDPYRFVLLLTSLLIGYGLNFVISLMVGLSVFWLEEGYGAFLLLMLVTDLLSGMLIPLSLMPTWLATITPLLPFYVSVGLPVDILTGSLSIWQSLNYLFVALIWFIGLIISSRFLYDRAIRNYTAVGI